MKIAGLLSKTLSVTRRSVMQVFSGTEIRELFSSCLFAQMSVQCEYFFCVLARDQMTNKKRQKRLPKTGLK